MNERIGIAVRARSVRMVLARGDRVTWSAERPFSELESLSSALAELARAAPRSGIGDRVGRERPWRSTVRLGMRRASVVLGPAWVQVRVLEGLPPLADARRLSSLVQLNRDAFFLCQFAGAPPVRVEQRGGVTLGAAYDSAAVTAVTSALRQAGLRVMHVAPTVRALSVLVHDGEIAWSDADDRLRLTFDDGSLTSIKRSAGERTASDHDDAAAAALLAARGRLPLAWRPEPTPEAARRSRVLLLAASAAACVLSLGLAIAGGGLRARHDVGDNTRALASLHAQSTAASRTLADLRRARATMERAARFAAERGRVTMMLADVARALPESTAVVTLRLDSLGGSITVVGSAVTAVLPSLVRTDRIADPRLVGSITRENGPAQLGRAAFRFRAR